MPRINLTDDRVTVLPPHVSAFLRRRLTELSGATLLLGGVGALLAYFSFNPSDPSWNTAATGPVHNMMGGMGAVVADASLQDFEEAYWGPAYPTLQQAKQEYDPTNFFKFQQSIRLPRKES